MEILECHEILAEAYANNPGAIRELLPEEASIEHPEIDMTVASLTAAAVLSGWLEDSHTLRDLADSIAHFRTLLASEVVSFEDWKITTAEVVEKLIGWGDAVTAYERN